MEKISQKTLHEALGKALEAAVERKSELLRLLFRTKKAEKLVVVVLAKHSLRANRGVEAYRRGLGTLQAVTEFKGTNAKKHHQVLPQSMVTKAHAVAETALITGLGLDVIRQKPYRGFTELGLHVLHGGCCSPCGEYAVGVWGAPEWRNAQIAQHFINEMNDWFQARLDFCESHGVLPNADTLK